ncbi:MAG: hypothetical protein EOM67_01895 [Spirochaetia bacterium]|nr:hypothetical protein [Spirochaetia bacterium]
MNRYIQRQIVVHQTLLDDKLRLIAELEEKVDTVDTPEQIVNVMNRVGYSSSGDTFYIFPKEQGEVLPPSVKDEGNEIEFFPKTLSPFFSLIIAFSSSLIITGGVFYISWTIRRTSRTQERRDESSFID